MKKIIFLGDSITDASHCFLENPLGNGYVNMVAEKLNILFILLVIPASSHCYCY